MQQSELALFAHEFEHGLEPLGASLRGAAQQLRGARELPFAPDELASDLSGLARELEELRARVAAERATIFVFGPAKAGKSTLLDALAGARVGEVSILPTYPCLERTRHGTDESARLLRFGGGAETLSEPSALALVLKRAHGELAVRAREVRAAGEAFDPARHLLTAVRRVERIQPAPPLAHGALELVECPPIHGPLFPSYSEMLIGEPDHARAGVFVLRAAQLADDAVFDGIEELLASFERLVLVVNLDERARELSRAGELAPSAEREDPGRLVAAFEERTLCEPLARAVRAGRVPVLALDLLAAARARLHGVEELPEAPARHRARFADLARELSGVLDAHESFRALAASALRRADELADEARELGETPLLAELEKRRAALARERAALEVVREALARLAARPRARWESEALFDRLRASLAQSTAARAGELAQGLEAPLARALEDWFASGTSLAELLRSALTPRLAGACAELARGAERSLREELRAGEPALAGATQAELAAARVDLGALLARTAEAVHAVPEPLALRALDVESIPVRPRLGQRLTLRNAADVRRALLGPPEDPAVPLDSAEKARRLGDEARTAMQRSAVERARAVLAEEAGRVARALDEAVLTTFLAELSAVLVHESARLVEPLRVLTEEEAELAELARACAALAPASERARAALADLAERVAPRGVLVPAVRLARAAGTLAREAEASVE
jgi:hypothetical protein